MAEKDNQEAELQRRGSSRIIVKQNTEDALAVIRESAEWLVSKGMPLWNPSDFDIGCSLDNAESRNYYAGYLNGLPAVAMILQWEDLEFWPNAKDDSGFIHKLSVKRAFAGRGVVQELVGWAKSEVLNRKRTYLRLDCDAKRGKLCGVYEKMGFVQVDRRFIGKHDVAFYEMNLRDRDK